METKKELREYEEKAALDLLQPEGNDGFLLEFDFSTIDKSITNVISGKNQSSIVDQLYQRDLDELDHRFDGPISSQIVEEESRLKMSPSTKKLKQTERPRSLTLWDSWSKFNETTSKNKNESENKEEEKAHSKIISQTQKASRKDRPKSLTLFDLHSKSNKTTEKSKHESKEEINETYNI